MRKRMLLASVLVGCVALAALARPVTDYYNCYAAANCQAPALSNDTACVENLDYTVTVSDRGSAVTVLSHHGGNIETKTSQISAELENLFAYNRYDFNAAGRASCLGSLTTNKRFHITSTHFDDPRAVNLVGSHPKAVAIHGYSDDRGYAKGVICVGGLDATARSKFISQINGKPKLVDKYQLNPIDGASAASGTTCGDLRGNDATNIVNRTSSQAGLQLELSKELRDDLTNRSSSFNELRQFVYNAIHAALS